MLIRAVSAEKKSYIFIINSSLIRAVRCVAARNFIEGTAFS